MLFDLVIHRGRVVRPDGISEAHLGITDGIIQAVTTEPITGRQEIDAAGKYVIPGLVDAHVHIPGFILPTELDDFAAATKAAAAGGVTTLLLMPTDSPRTDSLAAFERKKASGEGHSHVDYALQAIAGPQSASLDELAAAGAVSFELFLAYGGMPDFIVGDDDVQLARLLRLIRDVDGLAGITPHSPSLTTHLEATHRTDPDPGVATRAATRPVLSETLGLARALTAAAESGTRIHLRALSSRRSIDIVQRLRGLAPATTEAMSHHLLFTETDARRMGAYGVIVPPIRAEDDRAALRDAVRAGTIDMVVSDHSPCLPAAKEAGQLDIWQAPPGMTGLQTLCASMLALIDDNVLTLPDLVRLCCENPARAFRLYPRKGSLTPGADADIVIIDPTKQTLIQDSDQLSRANYTTLAGRTINARIERTLLRGQTIFQHDKPPIKPSGRFVRP